MEKRNYTPEQKERKRLYDIEYNIKNAEKKKEQVKQWRENNNEKRKLVNKEYCEKNKERKRLYDIEYRKKIAEKKKQIDKEYYNKNKEEIKIKTKEYRKNNKDKINLYHITRKSNDHLYKLICNIRSNIKEAYKRKGFSKPTKTEIILGCSFSEFKQHIESLWESWMTWENYGNPKDGIYEKNKTWDFDHIIEVSTGTTEDEILKLNHYSNIQPLCSYTNRWIKSNKII